MNATIRRTTLRGGGGGGGNPDFRVSKPMHSVRGGGGGGVRRIPDYRCSKRLLIVRWASGVGVEQTNLGGEAVQLGAALETELVTQVFAMGFDGLHTHTQVVGGFFIRVPLRQQP